MRGGSEISVAWREKSKLWLDWCTLIYFILYLNVPAADHFYSAHYC